MVSLIRNLTRQGFWQHLSAVTLVGIFCVATVLPYGQVAQKLLSKDEVIRLLKGDVSPKRVTELVQQRGVDFVVTPEIKRQLRKLGATDSLLAKLTELAPKPTPITPADVGTKVSSKDGLTYVLIPAGTFQMGCSPGDGQCFDLEKLVHTVRITKRLWVGQTLVTQAAYRRVLGTNPSRFKGERLPVENVTWDEARSYCSAVGMRLPTEAEWEYAARAGSITGRYGDLSAIAWYRDNSGGQTHEVAQKEANAWKLYDMLGNLNEWTTDWYDVNYYSQYPTQDPQGPSTSWGRVMRGGFWNSEAREVRVSYRFGNRPDIRYAYVGFRCVGGASP